MKAAPKFLGFVDDTGKFALDDRRAFQKHAETFKGKEVVLTLEEKKAQRSLDQNAYWWGVVVELLSEHCGYTPAQMHYSLLGEYGGYQEGIGGQAVPKIASSSELNTQEFAKLIDWVLTWAPSELGVVIPEPDPKWREKKGEAA